MNKGKICVSICAETAKDFIENIERAKEFADVVELRFDCLNQVEPERLWTEIKEIRQSFKGKLLATFRPFEQGGKRKLTSAEREDFWIHSHVFEFVDWADFEFDFPVEKIYSRWGDNVFSRIIKSFHDFKQTPSNLKEIFDRLSTNTSEVTKIAVQADDITDSIAVWKLLEKAGSENNQIIPIAMGEAGTWTRILGLAHGAFMTYAALDAGSETAPGQISARDLAEVYRVKELNEETEVFGILGENTSYSMSPFIHNAAFRSHNLNKAFVPLQVKNLDDFFRQMVSWKTREIDLNFGGFAVTIPHKVEIMRHLTHTDESAEQVGAVNTVRIVEDERAIYGFNTDAEGFIQPLHDHFGNLTDARAAVVGSGGTARAVCYALKKAGARVTVFARNLPKAERLKADFDLQTELFSPTKNYNDFDILVNTTPLGMKGRFEAETVARASQLEGLKLVYDVVYTPLETILLSEAQAVQVPTLGGLEMLVAQAAAQQKIWTGMEAPVKEMRAVALDKLRSRK